jgi:hypothetical protein
MTAKTPRPAARDGANRAAGLEDVSYYASDLNHTKPTKLAQATRAPIAWASIYVTRLGTMGYWVPQCPYCGLEGVHFAFAPFDPRERRIFARFRHNPAKAKSLGWYLAHCSGGWQLEYQLMLAPGPARFAPGAADSGFAKQRMAFVNSLGIEISDETLPSRWPLSWWWEQ